MKFSDLSPKRRRRRRHKSHVMVVIKLIIINDNINNIVYSVCVLYSNAVAVCDE